MNHGSGRNLAASVLLATLLTLTGCGGGGGGTAADSAATPGASPSSTASSGIVTGFGSVFVNGVEIDDSRASTRAEGMDGTHSLVAVQLGQRVRIERDSTGAATTVTIDAAVVGPVAAGSIDAAALKFTVAKQTVKANTDSAVGPLTVYGGGYKAFTDIAAGDLVEVHGSAVYDSTAAAYVVQATRIEKKPAITAVRVMGTIANLDTTAKTFSINGLTVAYGSATVTPVNATLAAGQTVAVWGPAGSLSTGGSTATLTAARVRVMNAALPDAMASGTTQLGGLVSNYSVSAGTFTIEGVKIVVGSASVLPVGATITNGAYVHVNGTVGSDGSIAASAIKVRPDPTEDDFAVVRLMGAIQSVTDQKSFVLRGVPVDASSINLATACPGVTLAAGTVVGVVAGVQPGTDVVLATRMICQASTPATIRALTGSAGSVDATAKTFVLTSGSATQKVQWNDKTVFGGVTAETLSGTTVVVEGFLDASGTLVARMIRNPAAVAGRMDADAYNGLMNSPDRSWALYRTMH